MRTSQQRQLDYESQQLIRQLLQTPIEEKQPTTQLYFDVAVKFGKTTEYRLLWFRFDARKLFLMRHSDIRTEILFSAFSYVTLENNPSRIKLIVNDCIETPKTYEIYTQSDNDTIQIFQILRSLSTVPKRCIYQQDYYLDYVNKKMFITCKKRGQKTWAKREMYIYNGLFILYQQGGQIPRTICPLSEKVQITLHPNNIMEITTPIRRILLHFDNERKLIDVYNCFMTCEQYTRQLYMPIKDFQVGKLGDLHQTCKDVCIKNNLYPEECYDNFPVLCEILRAVTKKRCVTVGDKKATKKEEEELTRRPPPPQQIHYPEDDLRLYCVKEDPKRIFTNWQSVGRGGFGEVFKAERKEDKKTVAVKVLRHSIDERYAKIGIEIARMNKWKHPNLMDTIGCYLHDHKVYIAMDYCNMGNLKQLLKQRNQQTSFPDIAFILLFTIKGLNYIHETGFIHRDIKTANILMTDRYCVKVIDFGLVVRKSSQPQNRAGSKSYMAPEVIKQMPYDEKIDIWSIGCVAQELFEGQPPYKEHGLIKGMFKTAAFGAQYLRDESKALHVFVDFINRCFYYNPRDRPSCADLLKHPFLQLANDSYYMRRFYESNLY